jgi:hypothetical protein
MYGQVIGVTSSKLASVEYDAVGYAIPTVTMKRIVEELIANGKVVTVNEHKAGNLFIVTSGLEGGEEIVAEGAGMVKENQKVK